MPASITSIRTNFDVLSQSVKDLRNATVKNSEEMAKVSKEVSELNKHNQKQVEKEKNKFEIKDPYPLVKYQPNEMTFSQLMVRKLDII